MSEDLYQLIWLFFKLGFLTVGGSDAVLSEMQRDVVARGWMSAPDFAEAYVLARLAPGPGGFVAIPIGYRAAGLAGAAAGFLAFVLPSTVLALGLVRGWRGVRERPWALAVRTAIAPISIGLILATVWVIGSSVIYDGRGIAIAAVMTVLCLRPIIPVALLPVVAGLAGLLLFSS